MTTYERKINQTTKKLLVHRSKTRYEDLTYYNLRKLVRKIIF